MCEVTPVFLTFIFKNFQFMLLLCLLNIKYTIFLFYFRFIIQRGRATKMKIIRRIIVANLGEGVLMEVGQI